MTEPDDVGKDVWKRWILEAIRKIRSQKQRPSVERICHAIRQHHNYHEDVVSERLERAVREGAVLKVYNKGQSSYKDPGGLQSRTLRIAADIDVSRAVAKAVRELGERDGSDLKTIEKHLQQAYQVTVDPEVDVRAVLKAAAKRAVTRGLITHHQGVYKATERRRAGSHERTPKHKIKNQESEKSPGGVPICAECLGTETRNSTGEPEALISCHQCKSYAHPTCLNLLDHTTQTTLKALRWSCGDCAWCSVCARAGGWAARCAGCAGPGARHAHAHCAPPPWRCPVCKDMPATPKRSTAGGMPRAKKGRTPRRAAGSDSEPSDGNEPPAPHHDQRMSKEKQKFFRFSAFNLVKRRRRASSSEWEGWHRARFNGVRVTRVQRLELRLERRRRRQPCSDSDSSSPRSSPRELCSPVHPPTIFERLASDSAKGVWGFAAEAQKHRPLDEKPVQCARSESPRKQEPRRIARRRSRCGERLLTTLFDGLSEFYSVRTESRSQSRHRGRPRRDKSVRRESESIDAERQVLKETRSTFRKHLETLKRERSPSVHRESPTLSASQLVRVAAGERHSPDHSAKLSRALALQEQEQEQERAPASNQENKKLPPGVTRDDASLFSAALAAVTSPAAEPPLAAQPPPRSPSAIEFGQWEIDTWYSSPFPQEYARLPKLFLCEFCLKYAKSRAVLMRHLDKCQWRHPPATEIYRCGDISVFEVDGNANKIYCQNLCLLAKLFLDHKTLYYDVEPFLFYVLTKNDNKGCHLIGYFSKEKHCQQKYNVSCIMTMPQYQRQGYGRFLIHFSYLLSKEEGQPGTPEKPLSDLGRVSYHAYWKSVILEFLHDHKEKPFTLEDIAHTTGMHMNDIAATFQLLGFVRYLPNNESIKLGLCIDWNRVENHDKRLRSRPRLEIDPECLRWTPLLAPTINPFRSPEEGSAEQDTENDETEMKTESEDTATEPETPVAKVETKLKVKAEKEKTPEPVEVTSSGRRRTRPLKYSETTYQTTPTVAEGGRKRKRDVSRKLSESNLTEDEKKPEETPRQQRSKSAARRSSRVAQNELNEDSNPPRSRRQSVKDKETYASDSQDSQEETADTSIAATASAVKAKAKRKYAWRGRPKKRQKVAKGIKVRTDSPEAKKAKIDEETNCKTDDEPMEEEKPKSPVQNHESPKSQIEEKPKEKSKNSDSSEDSSGEADDEMDVEEVEDRISVTSKPASPQQVEENSTDHHTSDMELDSIHMDSPKSIAEKEQVIKETSTVEDNSEKNDKPSEDNVEPPAVIATEAKPDTQKVEEQEVKNGEIKSPTKPSLDDKETIIISESDDNNSQSCPLPSPKPNNTVPAQPNNENKPKEVEENESPSKVIPVVSTENAHIVLDHKVQEEVNPIKPPVDLIVPKIHQIETIVVEGESDNGLSPHVNISPKLNDKTVINESPKQKRTPEKNMGINSEQRKSEMRKETVIQHQAMDELKTPEKKSPTKPDSLIQNVDLPREMNSMKLPELPKLDSYSDMDRNKPQNPIVSKESDIPFRNDILNTRKDEIIITRNVIEPNMINYQNSVSNSMTIQQINTAQHSYLNHRASVTKESQSVQTEKVLKTSEANRVNTMSDSPVISKPTKLEVPHPITSPVINPVIPKVPNVTDINFLPRCQSANAAISMGSERMDMDPNFANSNAIQNSLGGSMNIVQCSSQDKNDLKPREKSKLRDVRVNSAHSKLEKPEKKSKDTPRSTPEPKVVFFPEQNANTRKPETSVPINVINTGAGPVTSKPETKPTNEAPKKQDFFKKEKSNAAKCDSKNNTVKHDKTCTTQLALKAEQNDLNKMLPKLRYDNELVPKDYPMNQIPNYHTSHAQYQWPPWDPARLQGTWDHHNRFLDMKNSDKNYLDKFQGFNLPHLDQIQKSPQKLHPKYDQKDFHNIAYGTISTGIYATTGLPHFKETKAPTSKASECSQKNDSKPSKQSKTTACQTQCEPKKSQAQEAQMKQQMMQRQVKQQEATSCAEYRQQSPQILSPGCKTPYNNGPCSQEKDIEKKSRQKKEESPKESKEEMCEAVSPALQSMGVYTPDSTSNSVHSVQYPSCELDVSQLGLESPSSIGSDLASPCYMHATPSPQYPHSATIHIPSIMTQPQQPPKQQKINNRNRNASASSGGSSAAKSEPVMRGAATPPARHRTTPPAHQPHAGGGTAAGGAGYQGGYLSFQQQQQYHGGGWAPSCSLAKLQQMAEAPQHHHQQYGQQAGGTQHYHAKYYPAPNQLDAARTRTHSAPAPIPGNLSPMQHMQMAPTSRMSPNLNTHIISQYGLANSYRMPPQQQFNNLQMMNVQTGVQYSAPDPRAQQPNVYAYGYINAPPTLGLQTLNSTMRR